MAKNLKRVNFEQLTSIKNFSILANTTGFIDFRELSRLLNIELKNGLKL